MTLPTNDSQRDNIKIGLLVIICLLLITGIIIITIPQKKINTVADVFNTSFVACVSITCYFEKRSITQGSGFFVSLDITGKSRYLATCAHLLYEKNTHQVADHIEATYIDPSTKSRSRSITRSVSIIGIDGLADLALLFLDFGTPCNTPLSLHNLAKPGSIATGTQAVMIGDPYGLDPLSCSAGNVRDSFWSDPLVRAFLTCVMTNIPANKGNAGSPILDMNGNVLCIHNGTFATPETPETEAITFGGGVCAWYIEMVFKLMIDNDKNKRMEPRWDVQKPVFFNKLWFKQSNIKFTANSSLNQFHLREETSKSDYVFPMDVEIDGMLVIECDKIGDFQVGDIITHINTVNVGCSYSSGTIGDQLWFLDPKTTQFCNVHIIRTCLPIEMHIELSAMPHEMDVPYM